MKNNKSLHKYWKSVKINELINEIVEPDDVDVTSIKISDELNPIFWEKQDDEYKLKPEIRKTLLLNAKYFIDFCDLNGFKFNDITLTGSMANYNYSSYSDADVHIIFDYSQISDDEEFVSDYFKLKKDIWNNRLPIKIFEHDVEMYIQDADEKHTSTGVYSIYHDKWLIKPVKKIVNIDIDKIKEKSSYFMNEIDRLTEFKDINNFMKKFNILKEKLKKYRMRGLATGGEFSTENLVFKLLRNSGYLDKLHEQKKKILTNELSI